jgi:hypothetical protein
LIDHNLRGHSIVLAGSLAASGWLDLISIRFVLFEEMMQVMADALAGAVSEAVTKTATKPEIAGWEKFVRGCVVSLDFGAPINFSDPAAVASTSDYQKLLTNTLQTSVQPKGSGVALLGGSITIGGSWSF